MKSSKHIKILGAGISGLAAAINLVKSGYKVEIFEKRSEVGKRFHGDFQIEWMPLKNLFPAT